MTDASDRNKLMINAEVATEILNNVRGWITNRVYKLEASRPDEAKKLSAIRGKIYRRQEDIDFRNPEEVEAIINEWGPLLKDMAKGEEDAFWKRVDEEEQA